MRTRRLRKRTPISLPRASKAPTVYASCPGYQGSSPTGGYARRIPRSYEFHVEIFGPLCGKYNPGFQVGPHLIPKLNEEKENRRCTTMDDDAFCFRALTQRVIG